MKITAAVALSQNGALAIKEVDLAEPAAGEVLVRVVATGVCQTDLTVLASPNLPWPAIFGHEGAGIVEKVGEGVGKVAPGDAVLMTTASCGICPKCVSGNPSYCTSFLALNMSGGRCADGSCSHNLDGKPVFARFLGQSSFASHVLTRERSVIKIDPGLPLEILAPLGCGIQTGAGAVLNTLRPKPGSSLVIFGAGGVGLAALMAARIAGCSQIIAVDRHTSRLEVARELGATDVIKAEEGDVVETIRAMTGGGADYTVEAVGNPAVMDQAIESLGQGGVAVLVGVAGSEARMSLRPTALQNKGATVKGSLMAGENSVPELFIGQLIEYWREGRLPIEKILSFYDLSDINSAIQDARSGKSIKPVIRISERGEIA